MSMKLGRTIDCSSERQEKLEHEKGVSSHCRVCDLPGTSIARSLLACTPNPEGPCTQ